MMRVDHLLDKCACRWKCKTDEPGWELEEAHPGCRAEHGDDMDLIQMLAVDSTEIQMIAAALRQAKPFTDIGLADEEEKLEAKVEALVERVREWAK